MRCESALIRLDELRTGELDAREVGAVREHLEHCEYCDGVLRRIAGIATGARSLLGETPTSCLESLEHKLFDRVAPHCPVMIDEAPCPQWAGADLR